ncbi:hypothetical protein SISNIDRAFT_494821 [Sistotremastrum niveocremeum HHB9708]|uniref:Uncharacterized protein n=1 Tax=Sistotremastrum niveocremeum HHB9708 TaxID=1314777 RepID=A0A164WD74_9AGAM|nr:hypothetical protein SISNIDRAFT_494821 [Sistotremastrum niveocremeum HHB9708]
MSDLLLTLINEPSVGYIDKLKYTVFCSVCKHHVSLSPPSHDDRQSQRWITEWTAHLRNPSHLSKAPRSSNQNNIRTVERSVPTQPLINTRALQQSHYSSYDYEPRRHGPAPFRTQQPYPQQPFPHTPPVSASYPHPPPVHVDNARFHREESMTRPYPHYSRPSSSVSSSVRCPCSYSLLGPEMPCTECLKHSSAHAPYSVASRRAGADRFPEKRESINIRPSGVMRSRMESSDRSHLEDRYSNDARQLSSTQSLTPRRYEPSTGPLRSSHHKRPSRITSAQPITSRTAMPTHSPIAPAALSPTQDRQSQRAKMSISNMLSTQESTPSSSRPNHGITDSQGNVLLASPYGSPQVAQDDAEPRSADVVSAAESSSSGDSPVLPLTPIHSGATSSRRGDKRKASSLTEEVEIRHDRTHTTPRQIHAWARGDDEDSGRGTEARSTAFHRTISLGEPDDIQMNDVIVERRPQHDSGRRRTLETPRPHPRSLTPSGQAQASGSKLAPESSATSRIYDSPLPESLPEPPIQPHSQRSTSPPFRLRPADFQSPNFIPYTSNPKFVFVCGKEPWRPSRFAPVSRMKDIPLPFDKLKSYKTVVETPPTGACHMSPSEVDESDAMIVDGS